VEREEEAGLDLAEQRQPSPSFHLGTNFILRACLARVDGIAREEKLKVK
jgi:hypothetical protein